MKLIQNQEFGGERPLFAISDTTLREVTVRVGESSLKHGRGLLLSHCRLEGKYPLWHCRNCQVEDSVFAPGARAAIWYTRDLAMRDCRVEAPKMFRDAERLTLEQVEFLDAAETLWTCHHVTLRDCRVSGGINMYMHSDDLTLERCRHDGDYSFQWCRGVTVRDSVINCKDAFWNSEDVTVIDSEINGEYLGWYTRGLRLVNCRISGTQPLYYCRGLTLENCRLAPDCDLAFEYSELRATIDGPVRSIRNPRSGSVRADGIGELIIDRFAAPGHDCQIIDTTRP